MEPTRCPQCRTPLKSGAPHGLCTACLLQSVLRAPEPPSPPTARAPGASPSETSFGDFELRGELGRGGMGVVHRAWQRSLKREVALKLILAGEWASADFVERFRAEAEAAAALEHPNIVPVFAAGEHAGRHFIAMKCIDGPTLARELARRRKAHPERPPFEPAAAARLASTIARAMQHAHDRGVLHRDIKPGNLLLDRHGEPHLTDFGLAKLVRRDGGFSGTIAALGTPAYMAPEQALEPRTVTTAVDVYGLAATLYEMLTGRPPFAGGTSVETLRQVVEQDPPPVRRWAPEVSIDLETVCLRALAKEPARRYSSAGAFADDLDRWLTGKPVHARPVGRLERTWKWMRRHPARAGALAVALLATGVLLAMRSAAQAELRRERDAALFQLRRFHLQQADSWLAEGRVPAALAQFARVLRLDPDNTTAAQRIVSLLAHRDFILPTRVPPEVDARQEQLALGPGWRAEFDPADSHLHLISLKDGTERSITASAPIFSANFSTDGTRVALGTQDGFIQIFENATGSSASIPIQVGGAPTATFLREPDLLLTAGIKSKNVTVWNWRTGTRVRQMEAPPDVLNFCALDPGRRRCVVGGNSWCQVWDALDGRIAAGPILAEADFESGSWHPGGEVVALGIVGGRLEFRLGSSLEPVGTALKDVGDTRLPTFSGDGLILVAGGNNRPTPLWDWMRGVRFTEPALPFRGALQVRFLPGGHCLYSTRQGSRVGDALPGRELPLRLPHQDAITHVEFSPDGQRVVTASSDRTARLWDPATGHPASPPLVHADAVRSAHFSPDSKQLVTLGHDLRFRVWSALDGTPRTEWLPTPGIVSSVEFTQDGSALLIAGRAGIERWNLASSPAVRHSELTGRPVRMASLHPDGRSWAAVIVPEFDLPSLEFHNGATNTSPNGFTVRLQGSDDAVELSPDGTRLAMSAPGYQGRILQLPNGQPACPPLAHDDRVTIIKWSPDATRVLTASRDRTVRVWDAATGHSIGEPMTHAQDPWTAQWSPDGRNILSSTIDGTARLWDAQSGLPLSEPMPGHPNFSNPHLPPSTTARFSPDSRRFVLGSEDHAAVILHNPRVTLPIPTWLPDLAEGVAGVHMTAQGALAPVDETRLLALRAGVKSLPGDSFWQSWVRWLFADRRSRTTSAASTLGVPDYLARRRAEGTLEALREVARFGDLDAPLLREFAGVLDRQPGTNAPAYAVQARWLQTLAAQVESHALPAK